MRASTSAKLHSSPVMQSRRTGRRFVVFCSAFRISSGFTVKRSDRGNKKPPEVINHILLVCLFICTAVGSVWYANLFWPIERYISCFRPFPLPCFSCCYRHVGCSWRLKPSLGHDLLFIDTPGDFPLFCLTITVALLHCLLKFAFSARSLNHLQFIMFLYLFSWNRVLETKTNGILE